MLGGTKHIQQNKWLTSLLLDWPSPEDQVSENYYPNDPWIVTPPWQLWNALTTKRAGLVWTFLTEQWSRSGCHSVKKSPHKSSLFRRESITKLPGGCHYLLVVRHCLIVKCGGTYQHQALTNSRTRKKVTRKFYKNNFCALFGNSAYIWREQIWNKKYQNYLYIFLVVVIFKKI